MQINRPRRALTITLVALAVLGLMVAAASALNVRARVRGRLQQMGVLPPSLPLYGVPNAGPDRVSARRLVVASLHDALESDDYERAAELNAILSQEADQRAYRVLKAWESTRDPNTGLIPWVVDPHFQEWRLSAVGANLYSHLLIASQYLDPENRQLWEQILTYERETCGPMPCSIELGTGAVIEHDRDTLIRCASEYTRDGLLGVTERFGHGPWLDRLLEGVDAILEEAYVETGFGPIPANSTEVNGSQLQALARLYWLTRDERYLEMAERITEAYLFEVIPSNQGLPTDYWDFERSCPLPEDIRFRPEAECIPGVYPFRISDHGGEIIAGLTEVYYLERMLNRPQAERYRRPLQEFLDRLLEVGRTGEGLWVHSIVVDTLEPFDDNLSDTWGYTLNGFHTFDVADGTDRYASEIVHMMRNVAATRSVSWEGDQADGYADTIESMLYLLPWFDLSEAHCWVDDEIEVMFLKQQDDGFVEGWFLDGNFVRTTLLYSQYKTAGLRVLPWSEGTRLGAALDREADALHVYLAAEEDWQGILRFDTRRHETIWGMPVEYPRVNGLPEWYPVDLESTYVVTDLDTGDVAVYSGQELAEGLPLDLHGAGSSTLRLMVSEQ